MPTPATWNTGNGLWFNGANWDEPNPDAPPPLLHYVPGPDEDVRIPDQSLAGTPFTVTYDGEGAIRSLTAAANATLDLVGGTLTTLTGGSGFGTLRLATDTRFTIDDGTFSTNALDVSGRISGDGTLRLVNAVSDIRAGAVVDVAQWLLTYQIGSGTVSITRFHTDLTYSGDFQLLQVFGNAPILRLQANTITLSGTALLQGTIEGPGTLKVTGTGRFAGTVDDGARLEVAGVLVQDDYARLGGALQIDAGGIYSIDASADLADIGGATILNNGLFRQTAAGVARVDADFTNNGVIAVASGAQMTLIDSDFQLNGTVSGAGRLVFGFAHDVTLNTSAISVAQWTIAGGNGGGTTTLARNITYGGAFTFAHTGTLDLNGRTLTLSSAADLDYGTIDGTGALRITGSAVVSAIGIGYQGTAATLRNSGAVTQDGQIFLNGTILNDAGRTYTLKAGTIAGVDGRFTNNGIVTAAAGTANDIQTAFDTVGTLSIAAGATLRLAGASTLAGTIGGQGTLTLSGAATVGTAISTAALNLNGTTTLSSDLAYAGAFTIGTFSTTRLGGHTLELSGVAHLVSGFNTIGGSGVLKITGDATIGGVALGSPSGAIAVRNLGSVEQVGSVSLRGTLTNEGGHTYAISGGSITNDGAVVINRGTITVAPSSGGLSEINSTFTQEATGVLSVGRGATLRLAGDATVFGTVTGAGKLILSGTTKVYAAIGTSALEVNGAATLSETYTYRGAFSVGTFAAVNLDGSTLTLAGSARFDTGFNSIGNGGLRVTGTATINGIDLGSAAGAIDFINNGTTVQTGGFRLSGQIVNASGRTYTLTDGDISADGAARILNLGLWEKEGAAGNATIRALFTNEGFLAVRSGVLHLDSLVNIGVIEGVIATDGARVTVTADSGSSKTQTGGSGNNRLDGGAGADTLRGGAGNDTYVVNNRGDRTIELAGAGTDTVEASVSTTLAPHIERLVLTGTGALNGTGNDLANTITGNGAANIIDGGANADQMTGGAGDDTYIVDHAGDRVFEAKNGGTDTVRASVSFSLSGQAIENLVLTGSAAINATGNSGANTVTGNRASNTIDGGGNADRMTGGAGNDTYVVDHAGDRVFEVKDGGTDTVRASVSFSLSGQAIENLVLTGSAAINATGNSGANTITGNGAANIIDGGGNADRMTGGAGNDTYVVDHAGDRVFEVKDGGTDTVRASVSFSLSGQAIENLVLTGSAAINATGNSGANTITGNGAANIIDGGGNADRMTGGAGNDTYVVDHAGDRVFEAKDGGTDTVRASVSFSLSGQAIENLVLTGSAAINATGNSGANTITGNGAANVIDGGAGADRLAGGAGADSFSFSTPIGGTNVDRIADFSLADDTIRLSASVFGALTHGNLAAAAFKDIGTGSLDANDRILYDRASGAVFYDADGSGEAAAIRFATLDTRPSLTHADVFVV
ncbi:beta strand repeat-containing protein [Ensifer soli]|uniref:beta strand repeat-containing protein n=1 Tax=Ciceribacter sp. sgz301302 TaxID=3342379 RepID=UPI0035BA512B